MSTIGRKVALALLFALSALPCFAIAIATASSIASAVSSPAMSGDYALAYAGWWLGLLSCVSLLGTSFRPGAIRALLLLGPALGLVACSWLEWNSMADPKRIVPLGIFVLPYAGSSLFLWLGQRDG
jgi:hypothetical protein